MTVLDARPTQATTDEIEVGPPPPDRSAAGPRGPGGRRGGRRGDTPRRRRHLVRNLAIVLAVVMVPVGWSYAGYLTAPGDAPLQVRSVDWLRDHGFESAINDVEQWWYTRKRPTGSHPPKADIPIALRRTSATVPADADRAVTADRKVTADGSVTADTGVSAAGAAPQRGTLEAVWMPVAGLASGPGAVQETYLHPDAAAPAVIADVVRFDQSKLRTVYVPGTKEPGGTWAWGSEIPMRDRPTVIAAFNAGFKFRHTRGGVYTEGRHAVRPLEAGLASLVIDRSGRADVVAWPGPSALTKDVVSVRQNLDLIVDAGAPAKGLKADRGGRWGTKRSQFQYTWRSAVGVDAQGRLLYAAGSQITLTQLARAMVDAGAVRAMQLDIHDGVVTFNWFRPDPASKLGVSAAKLSPSMQRKATRFLSADWRDFIAVQVR
ncbi:MAG: phosphodiester glycosidase family protein [Actinobacteria bacterium]|nr:phosphodiester glycosidase family protein [Actinomycetota bacterium]